MMWVFGLPLTLLAVAGILAALYITQHLPAEENRSRTAGSGARLPAAAQEAIVAPPISPIADAPAAAGVPDDSRERIAAALLALKSGDPAGAEKVLSEVDLAKAAFPPAWELAGMLREAAGDSRAAMELYSQGIESAPSEGLYYRRAVLRRNDKQFDLALSDMDRATAHPPVHALLTNERILLLIQMGRKKQAGEEIKSLGAHSLELAGWIFGLCGMSLENGDYKEAGRLLALGKKSAAPAVFQQILKNPVLSRHQSQPEMMPFYFGNIDP